MMEQLTFADINFDTGELYRPLTDLEYARYWNLMKLKQVAESDITIVRNSFTSRWTENVIILKSDSISNLVDMKSRAIEQIKTCDCEIERYHLICGGRFSPLDWT